MPYVLQAQTYIDSHGGHPDLVLRGNLKGHDETAGMHKAPLCQSGDQANARVLSSKIECTLEDFKMNKLNGTTHNL